jgi:TolA-binding protein
MIKHQVGLGLCCALMIAFSGCSRQQSDWQKTRETNTAGAYEQFLKKYPSGEFTAQAEARAKELYEERDWQKARDTDTPEAYQAFLKQYPEGKWTEEARIRVENFTLAQAPSGAPAPSEGTEPDAASAGAVASMNPAVNAAPPAPPAPQAPSATAPAHAPPATAAARAPAPIPAPPAAKAPASNPPGAPAKADANPSVNALSGPYRVQLGAFKSGADAAKEHWVQLQQGYPGLLGGLQYKVLPKKTETGSLYRLQAVGLSEKHARAVCTALKSKAQPCIVVPPV